MSSDRCEQVLHDGIGERVEFSAFPAVILVCLLVCMLFLFWQRIGEVSIAIVRYL